MESRGQESEKTAKNYLKEQMPKSSARGPKQCPPNIVALDKYPQSPIEKMS
jgi:hypothetical protein